MKKKNNIPLLLFFLLATTVFFGLPSSCISKENSLIISEIMYDPEGTDTGHADWIELYNPDEKTIALKKDEFGIIDEEKLELGADGKHYLNCHKLKENMDIPSKSYAIISSDKEDFANDYPKVEKSVVASSAFSLSSSGDYLHISNDSCVTFFIEISYENSWGGKNNGNTLEKINFDDKYSKDDWQESYVSGGTPGESNSKKPNPKEYKNRLVLSEILPHPTPGQEEYIELYNPEKEDVDLENWILRDGSKTGKYVFPKNIKIKSLDYLTLYKKDFGFALNDSGEESVSIYDPNERLTDSMTYSTSKENYSWDFDGSKWRLSSHLTPSKVNIFEKILEGKVEMDKNIYAHIYANFKAIADKDAQKFTWDFGDNHKSYLQKTRHKYEKSGKYEANLKITGHGEDNSYSFIVEVEDYSAPKVKIISFIPNPKGKDSQEYLVLENKSKGKVNLLNWSIATGWKNLYNHPIRDNFTLKKNESKKLTKKICAFTLNNAKTKIELRDPTGSVVQKIKYDRTKDKILEDEAFELSGKNWQWNAPPNTEENKSESDNSSKNQSQAENSIPAEITRNDTLEEFSIVTPAEIKASAGKYTNNPTWQNKTQNRIILLSYNSHIKTPEAILANQGKILGVSIEKHSPPEKHWAIILFGNILRKINSWLNWVLNKL